MQFLDADVERPLAFVSAVVDEGNVVVFGLRVSSLEKTGSPEDSDAWKVEAFFHATTRRASASEHNRSCESMTSTP